MFCRVYRLNSLVTQSVTTLFLTCFQFCSVCRLNSWVMWSVMELFLKCLCTLHCWQVGWARPFRLHQHVLQPWWPCSTDPSTLALHQLWPLWPSWRWQSSWVSPCHHYHCHGYHHFFCNRAIQLLLPLPPNQQQQQQSKVFSLFQHFSHWKKRLYVGIATFYVVMLSPYFTKLDLVKSRLLWSELVHILVLAVLNHGLEPYSLKLLQYLLRSVPIQRRVY